MSRNCIPSRFRLISPFGQVECFGAENRKILNPCSGGKKLPVLSGLQGPTIRSGNRLCWQNRWQPETFSLIRRRICPDNSKRTRPVVPRIGLSGISEPERFKTPPWKGRQDHRIVQRFFRLSRPAYHFKLRAVSTAFLCFSVRRLDTVKAAAFFRPAPQKGGDAEYCLIFHASCFRPSSNKTLHLRGLHFSRCQIRDISSVQLWCKSFLSSSNRSI